MIKLLKNHLGKYKWIALLAILFISIQSISELMLPGKMQQIITAGITLGDTEKIISIGLQMLLLAAIVSICAVIASLLMSVAASGLAKKLRHELFIKVTKATSNQISPFGTSSLITRTTNDVTQLQQMVVMSRMLFMTPILGIGSVILAVVNARQLSWIIVIIGIVLALAVTLVILKVNPLFRMQQKRLDKLNLVLREGLTGVRVIRAFNRTESDNQVFDDANKDLTEISLKAAKIMAMLMPVVMLLMNVTTIAVVWVGAGYINDGIIDVGQMSAFTQYITHVLMSMMFFSMMIMSIPKAMVSAERINAVLDSNSEIDNSIKSTEISTSAELEFKNVTFRFKGAESPVLKNISFVAKSGQTTAIIGSTGSGKSTLIDLIPRYYDIESGEILIGGVDISHMDIESLRQKIGLVPQKAVLFTGTIADNIKYGKLSASDEEVETAAKIAMAYDFVMKKPLGFDDIVAQGGTNLSGGQKQRLCIARALIRKPQVYIFDDSFSALDFKTDAKLRSELKNTVHNSVMLVVAQRISTIRDAEQIIVLQSGSIAGIGTHNELYENCEVYKEIALSQLSEEELKNA